MSHDDEHHELLPEGEEAPPPLTKTMAAIRWGILTAIGLFAVVMFLGMLGIAPWEARGEDSTLYHCPMHPTYISNQPGECPICGMSLVPVKDDNQQTQQKSAPESETTEGSGYYICPMHPEVISKSPGRCPKCNMFLEFRSSEGEDSFSHEMARNEDSQVPGLVPITLELPRQQLIGVRRTKAIKENISDKLRLSGQIVPDETRLSRMQVRFSGWIKKLYANETGQYVRRGDTIAVIYSPELYQAIAEYKNLTNAPSPTLTSELVRASREKLKFLGLSDEDIGDIDNRPELPAEFGFRSSLSGYMIRKNMVEGQRIDPMQELAVIADLSTVWVIAATYEQDIDAIKIGQPAEVKVQAFPSMEFHGQIELIYPDISPDSRSGLVRIGLANSDMLLRPGMFAEVEITTGQYLALTVPSEAVIDAGFYKYVFAVHDKTHFEPRLVKTGRNIDDKTVILAGLREGDEVVSSANFLIDSESRLKAALIEKAGTAPTSHEGH